MDIRTIGASLLSAAVGTTGKEAAAGGFMAGVGTYLSVRLGGWDVAVQLLLLLMIADYISGVAGAFKTKTVNSDIMFWGGVRKGVVMLVVVIAVMFDEFAGNQAPIFRTLALYFYIGREGLSVIENMGVIGVQFPAGLTKFLEQIKAKGDGK